MGQKLLPEFRQRLHGQNFGGQVVDSGGTPKDIFFVRALRQGWVLTDFQKFSEREKLMFDGRSKRRLDLLSAQKLEKSITDIISVCKRNKHGLASGSGVNENKRLAIKPSGRVVWLLRFFP